MIPLTPNGELFVISIEDITLMLLDIQVETLKATNTSIKTGAPLEVPSIETYLKNKIIDSMLKYSGQGN